MSKLRFLFVVAGGQSQKARSAVHSAWNSQFGLRFYSFPTPDSSKAVLALTMRRAGWPWPEKSLLHNEKADIEIQHLGIKTWQFSNSAPTVSRYVHNGGKRNNAIWNHALGKEAKRSDKMISERLLCLHQSIDLLRKVGNTVLWHAMLAAETWSPASNRIHACNW